MNRNIWLGTHWVSLIPWRFLLWIFQCHIINSHSHLHQVQDVRHVPHGVYTIKCVSISKHDLLSVAMVSFTTFGCSVVSFLLKTQWLLTYLISNALSSVGGAATCFRMILQVKKSLNSSICLIQNTQFIQYGCFNIKFFSNYVSNDSTSLYYCFNIDRKILFH